MNTRQPPPGDSPFTAPLMRCPDCGATFYADEYHDLFCGFPGHGALARWWRRTTRAEGERRAQTRREEVRGGE